MKQLVLTPEVAGSPALELAQGSALIGRAVGCAVRLDGQVVSGKHALVCAHPHGFYVADQSSTNGTWLNTQRVETAWLNDGDLLRLGPDGPALRVAIRDAERAALDAAAYAELQRPFEMPQVDAAPPTLLARAFDDRATSKAIRPPRRESRTGQYLLAALVSSGLGVLIGLLMLLELGPVGLLVGAIAAFVPAPFYATVFVWLDRYDPEPPGMLIGAFGWGALFALFVSFVGNTMFGITASALVDAPTGDFLTSVISAPFIEEGSKGLALLVLMFWFRRYFDGVLDGIVYAGLVALGFATVENVQYYGRMFMKEGFSGLLILGILRGGLSPFSHALFTCMTGIGCGLARESHSRIVKWVAPVAGYCAAVFLHGLWNLIASSGGEAFFALYFVVWVPLFLVFMGTVLWLGRRERRIIRDMLQPEVSAGTITEAQRALVGSFFDRFFWVMSALGDRARYKARREFLQTAGRLALCYWHVARAAAVGGQTTSLPNIPAFRLELAALAARV
jgi:RsiW-degrading membrane proteinase PrsW (M82 family)